MRHEKLSALDPLVGEWVMQASIAGQPTGRSRAEFEWAEGAPSWPSVYGPSRWASSRRRSGRRTIRCRWSFTAVFSPDGSAIDGAWGRSGHGAAWEHDFAVSYAKVG